jgi:hypothetical protein
VQFPTPRAATIEAIRRDGTRVRLRPGGARVRLADVVAVQLGRGYRLVRISASRGATLVAVRVRYQPTNPRPGPTLRVDLVRHGAFHERFVGARIVPTG